MSVKRAPRWKLDESIQLVDAILKTSKDYIEAAKYKKLAIYYKNCVIPLMETTTRSPEQLQVRFDNLLRDYRRLVKENKTTGIGDGEEDDQNVVSSICGSTDLFEACEKAESIIHPARSVYLPSMIITESGQKGVSNFKVIS